MRHALPPVLQMHHTPILWKKNASDPKLKIVSISEKCLRKKSLSCSSCLSHCWPIASPCVRSFEPFLADQMTLPGPSIHSRGRFVPLCVLGRPRFGLKSDICEIGQSWRETGWGRRFTLIHCGLDLRFIYNVTCLTQASLFNPFFRFRYICRISQM